ncbi:MAG TPA: hypothetical protein VFV86_06455 [Nitrososphaeraceae archaeon]|nr:hypothetical protein [Nitrososphaeraceae archaeon]
MKIISSKNTIFRFRVGDIIRLNSYDVIDYWGENYTGSISKAVNWIITTLDSEKIGLKRLYRNNKLSSELIISFKINKGFELMNIWKKEYELTYEENNIRIDYNNIYYFTK